MTSPLPLPHVTAPEPRSCRCGRPVPKGPLVEGWGSGCARERGLVTHVPRYRRLLLAQDGLFEINEGDEMTAETYIPKFVYDDPEEVRVLIRVTGDPGALGEIANELLSDLDNAYKRIDVAYERLDRAGVDVDVCQHGLIRIGCDDCANDVPRISAEAMRAALDAAFPGVPDGMTLAEAERRVRAALEAYEMTNRTRESPMVAGELAQLFHETYEELAPLYGYRTREASAKPWAEVPEQNRALMTATCGRVLLALFGPVENREG